MDIILIILAVVGTIIGIFKEEVVNFLFGGRKYKYLRGEWACQWVENPNKRHPDGKLINDRVTIKNVFGRLIKGHGSTGDLGKWTINGEISESVITISYKPDRDSLKHNLGVVILEVEYNNKNQLKGKWYQFDGHELVGGDANWVRVS